MNILKQKLLAWFLTIPLSQIYSQINKNVISNLKLEDQGQKKTQSSKIDLGVFCKKTPS